MDAHTGDQEVDAAGAAISPARASHIKAKNASTCMSARSRTRKGRVIERRALAACCGWVMGAWREREHASGRATYPGPHRCLIKTCRRRVVTMGSSGAAIHIQSYSCDANTGAKNVGRCPRVKPKTNQHLPVAFVSMRTLDTYRTGQAYYNLLRQLEMAKFTPSSLNPRIVV